MAGWKFFTRQEFAHADEMLDVPDFMARSIRKAAAPGARVTNENALFMHPETGLRHVLEPEQIADYEWVATLNSHSLLRGLRALRPGMTEFEAFAQMNPCGIPFSCYPICVTGERLKSCILPSPSSHRIRLAEPGFMTLSYQGANTCRFGWVARGPNDLPRRLRDYATRTAAPYFGALAAWYETLAVGTTGDQLHRSAHDILDPLGFTVGLNVGHQIAGDEWTHSLVSKGSTMRVRSGMYFQADFFAVTNTPHFGAFAEDGVVVADAALRRTFASRYPVAWRRFQTRRKFMIEQLGIRISDDLLPMSNFPATVIPYLLAPNQCMAFACR